MGFRTELDDLVRYRNAYLLAASATMGSVFFGWDIGLIGGVLSLPSFQTYFGVDKKSPAEKADFNGNIVSVLQAGCLFGALSTGYFSKRFGRKKSLIGSGIIYLVGSLLQTISGLGSSSPASAGLKVLFFSRFVGGIGVGMVSALVPAYVSECMPRTIRGRCTGFIQLAGNIGIMLSFWINYSASKNMPPGEAQWRLPFAVQMIPGAIFILLMAFQPESPRWLVEREQYDRAAATLAYIVETTTSSSAAASHNDDDTTSRAVRVTLDEIKADFTGRHHLTTLEQIKRMGESRTTALRCFLPSLAMFFQQFTGTNAVNYFSPEIFAGLGITGNTGALLATGVYGVVKVVSVALVLAFAVESLGRKRCLILGGLGQALTMFWIAGYTAALHASSAHASAAHISAAAYISILSIYLYAAFFCLGWGPIPWVLASELVPNHLRPAALSLSTSVNWLAAIAVAKLTPVMLVQIPGGGTFALFGACCVVMAAWAYLFLPETKGYALEDVRYLFENEMVLRSLEDAPGGRWVLRTFVRSERHPLPVAELRRRDEGDDGGRDRKSLVI